MFRFASLIHRFATWLTASDRRIESAEPRDWSDLPTYHPATSTDR